MPAYTSITFSFPRPIQPDLIAQFYRTFMSDGIAFKSVHAWSVGDETKKTLEDIIAWNQKQAELITPPDEEGYMKTDEWQVCLDVQGFYECRLIQSSREAEIWMRCIVPEGQVSVQSITIIERAALRVWEALPVRIIETSGELDTDLGYALVRKGIQPSVMPFAFLDEQCAPLASKVYFKHEKLSRGAILRAKVEDKTQVLFEGTEIDIACLEIVRIYKAISSQLETSQKHNEEIFSHQYMIENSSEEAVTILVEFIQEGLIQLVETDLNQLAFIARDYGLDFRSPHLKGTWIDDDETQLSSRA